MEHFNAVLDSLTEGQTGQTGSSEVTVYDQSHAQSGNTNVVMVKDNKGKWLVATGEGELFEELEGTDVEGKGKVCALTHANRLVLNKHFDYTVPRAFGTKQATMGLGDRLGIASPGHIETLRNRKVKPILAQQSIRELTLTNRSMNDMLDAAAFAVFQEGYKGGYGADGDHIKEEKDIEYALSLGVSMLTLDCSDQIKKNIDTAEEADIQDAYDKLPKEVLNRYNEIYLDQVFDVNGLKIEFDRLTLMKNVLIYGEALNYTQHVYEQYITKAGRDIDFELSIDETETVTSPDSHFFVANELKSKNVLVTSLAPRFCGEFQKGIDYIGDVEQFERELSEHAAIAEHFGYKLSIHSGSDKFSVFPIISKYTKGILHVKTAGTNWLEAVRAIARIKPDLYRRMHTYAMDHLDEALKYYHITPDLDSIDALDSVSDEQLAGYMDNDAARQVLHVTYGILLTAKNDQGNFIFKDEFFNALNDNEQAYREALISHIGKHVDLLNL